MDKDFQNKVRKKRIRAVAVAVIVIVVIVGLIKGTRVEKSDYTDSLNEQIKTAENMLSAEKDNRGNDKGEYAPYTLETFEVQISKAKTIFKSEDSGYEDKKEAYETLKEQTDTFKDSANKDVITADEMQNIVKSGKSAEYSVEWKKDTKVTYTVNPSEISKACTVNLMAAEEGPFYDAIIEMLSKKSVKGQVISFYQDGSFGGKLTVTVPVYSKKPQSGYVYKVDFEKEKLVYKSKAKINVDKQTATFKVSEGGDYIICMKELKKSEVKVSKEASKKSDNSSSSTKTGDSAVKPGSGNSSSDSDDSVTVTVEIRCDELAEDLSRLTDDSLKDYVPSDGTILKTTKVKVKKGESAYTALEKICRNKDIHLEASYTPAYGSYYVEGINYLYEFDAGSNSGWMYKVNGVFPDYGSSEYKVKDGDRIVWVYTCNLGKDVGDEQ